MKSLKLFGIVACLAMAACSPMAALSAFASTQPDPPAVAQSGAPATTGPCAHTSADETLLYAAEAAYNVPAQAYLTANAAGQLSPALHDRAKALLIQAYARLQDARRLYALCNADGFSAAVNAAMGLANSAKGLLSPSAVPVSHTPTP